MTAHWLVFVIVLLAVAFGFGIAAEIVDRRDRRADDEPLSFEDEDTATWMRRLREDEMSPGGASDVRAGAAAPGWQGDRLTPLPPPGDVRRDDRDVTAVLDRGFPGGAEDRAVPPHRHRRQRRSLLTALAGITLAVSAVRPVRQVRTEAAAHDGTGAGRDADFRPPPPPDTVTMTVRDQLSDIIARLDTGPDEPAEETVLDADWLSELLYAVNHARFEGGQLVYPEASHA